MRISGLVVVVAVACDSGGPADSTAHREAALAAGRSSRPANVVILTGHLDAATTQALRVPPVANAKLSLSWLIADGTRVEPGARVVEFDMSDVTLELERLRSEVKKLQRELGQQKRQSRIDNVDKASEFELAQLALKKARILATIDRSLVPGREYQERQLALQRARLKLTQAKKQYAATRREGYLRRKAKMIELRAARRAALAGEKMIQSLAIEAPVAGVVRIGRHPWTDEKFFAGDEVRSGWTVASVPDLSALIVRAKLSDVDDGHVSVGLPCNVFFDAIPGHAVSGRIREVTAIAREVDSTSLRRAFDVIVDLDGDRHEWARAGMSARVEVIVENVEQTLSGTSSQARASHRGRP